MRLVISGTSYVAALSHIEPEAVTPVGYGFRATLEAPDAETRELWLEIMIAAACDMADEGHWDVVHALYQDIERADKAREKAAA